MNPLFSDRADAGRQLSDHLVADYGNDRTVVVLALPRGGVPVAYEVASRLQAPLDIFIVRKLGVPGHSELAMGAIASDGVRVINEDVVDALNIPDEWIEEVTTEERRELERREHQYRGDLPRINLTGRTAILVDDGLATGASMFAAIKALRTVKPSRIVVAVPIAAPETCALFDKYADDVICAETPRPFYSVGTWYEDFSQTTDDEVRELLDRATKYLPDVYHRS